MAAEPSGGGYRPTPGPARRPPPSPPQPGRRRVLPAALVAVALLASGAAAAAILGGAIGGGVEEVDAAGLSASARELQRAHRSSVRRAMTAPTLVGVRRKKLDSIADCESHGDPRATSSDGTYRGKYQFDKGTWRAMGGSGDPAKAPELEQDIRAAELYKAASTSPWPNCG